MESECTRMGRRTESERVGRGTESECRDGEVSRVSVHVWGGVQRVSVWGGVQRVSVWYSGGWRGTCMGSECMHGEGYRE